MKLLTEDEVKAWCETKGLTVTGRKYLAYREAPMHCFTAKLVGTPDWLHALVGSVVSPWVNLYPPEVDETFGGALLWIRERHIGIECSENTAEQIMQLMHQGLGSSEDIDKLPGVLFGPDELWAMHAFLCVPLFFAWDAFVVLESPSCFVFISHDDVLELVAPSRGIYEINFQRCEHFKPWRDLSWYPRLVGR